MTLQLVSTHFSPVPTPANNNECLLKESEIDLKESEIDLNECEHFPISSHVCFTM